MAHGRAVLWLTLYLCIYRCVPDVLLDVTPPHTTHSMMSACVLFISALLCCTHYFLCNTHLLMHAHTHTRTYARTHAHTHTHMHTQGLQVHHDPEQTSYYNLYLYAPVWVINKTGQDLCYSVRDIQYMDTQ